VISTLQLGQFGRQRFPVGTDPNFSSVSALLHMNGTNGSTTFTDQTGKTWSQYGSDFVLSTAVVKFGTASLKCYLSTSTNHIETAHHADFNLPGDFTIEWWQYWTALNPPPYQAALQHGYNVAGGLTIVTGNMDGKYGVYINTLTLVCTEATAGTTGAWVHYALTRSGSTVTLWRGGVSSASGSNAADLSVSKVFAIGGYGSDSGALGQAFNGYIDDFRVTKGVARYTATFTPPTSAFPDS